MTHADSTEPRESRNITLGLLPMLVVSTSIVAPAALAQTAYPPLEPAPVVVAPAAVLAAPAPVVVAPVVVAPAAAPVAASAVSGETIQLEPIDLHGVLRSQAPTPQQYMDEYKVDGLSSAKFTQPLLDTPRTVTVITQREIEERGSASLSEVLRTTPGITLGSGEGGTPVGDRPFIRGFEASTDIFVDGQRNLGRSAYESFNTEALEISKGPGSAYTGRGSTGGSLNIVSKQPADENFLHANSTLGTDSYFRQTIDANYYNPQADVAVRLNALFHDADVPGRGPRDERRLGISPSVAWGLRGPTQAVLSLYHFRSEEMPDLGVPFETESYWRDARGLAGVIATKDNPLHPIDDIDRDNFYGSARRDFRDVETTIGTFKLRHEFQNGLTAQNVFSYNRGTNEYAITRPTVTAADGLLVARDLRSSARRNTSWGNRTDFTYELDTGPVEHDLAFGVEIAQDKLEAANLTFSTPASLSNLAPTGLYNPDPWSDFAFSPTIGDYGDPTRTKTASLYLFDTLKFNDQWLLNLGVRYDDYKVSSGLLENHSKLWNYQAGLTYKPVPEGSLYFAFGSSSNPSGETAGQSGGADGAAGGGLNNNTVNLDPEKTYSYEAGVKWDFFDGALQATAAGFFTDKTNQRASDGLGGVVLVGNSQAKGVELGLRGAITDRWNVAAGYTYVDSVIKDDGAGTNDGNQAKYIAPHSFNLWTTYDVTPKITVGGGLGYMSSRFANDDNTLELPSHVRVDLMASYEVNDNFTLRANATNLFDEKIYDGSHVGLFANMAPGRLLTLTGEVKF